MSTKATVEIVLEIALQQPWSDQCTMDQVRTQALRQAREAIGTVMRNGDAARLGLVVMQGAKLRRLVLEES